MCRGFLNGNKRCGLWGNWYLNYRVRKRGTGWFFNLKELRSKIKFVCECLCDKVVLDFSNFFFECSLEYFIVVLFILIDF